MIWLTILALFVVISLPVLFLYRYGNKRSWLASNYIPYMATYAAVLTLVLLWAVGARGLFLVGGTAIVIALVVFVMFSYSRLFS